MNGVRVAALALIIIGLLLMNLGDDTGPTSVSCTESMVGDTYTTDCEVS